MKKLILVAATLFSFNAMAAGDAEKGKALFATCVSCHGADAKGQDVLNAPNLNGLQEWYFVRQINNFKSGVRGSDPKDIYGAQMRPMSMTLADDQAIMDVYAYIQTLNK